MIQPKGLQDYLNEDSSLTEKITYEQYEKMQNNINPTKDVENEEIANAYDAYKKVRLSSEESSI